LSALKNSARRRRARDLHQSFEAGDFLSLFETVTWPKLPAKDKRRIVESIVEKITIGLGEIDITLSYLPTSEELVQNQQALLHLLACCHRTIRIRRSSISKHFRQLRRYPINPKTLGEHLRKKRIDMHLSMTQLAQILGLGVSDSAIEKWEKNQNRPTDEHRFRIVEFLGFDPHRRSQQASFDARLVGNLP